MWKNDRLKQIYKRPEIKASIEIILSVFAMAFLLMVVVRPTIGIVAQLQKKITDQDLVDKKMTSKITQLARAKNDLTTFGGQLDLFSKAITDDSGTSDLAKRLSLLVQESGLSVNSFSIGSVPVLGKRINLGNKDSKVAGVDPNKPKQIAGTKVAYTEIVFDLLGSQKQALDFLSSLEKIDRLIKITNLDIKSEDQKYVDLEKILKEFG
jgi:hypothetical protein